MSGLVISSYLCSAVVVSEIVLLSSSELADVEVDEVILYISVDEIASAVPVSVLLEQEHNNKNEKTVKEAIIFFIKSP